MSEGLTKVMARITEKYQYQTQCMISRKKAAQKQGNTLEREIHRPLSLLNMPSKIYEGTIGENIDGHFTKKSRSSNHLWAGAPTQGGLEGQLPLHPSSKRGRGARSALKYKKKI